MAMMLMRLKLNNQLHLKVVAVIVLIQLGPKSPQSNWLVSTPTHICNPIRTHLSNYITPTNTQHVHCQFGPLLIENRSGFGRT
jgi:hypothetical protein